MESLAKTVRGPQKFIYKHIYSTRNKKNKNVELVDIPTDDESEFDVEEVRIRLPWKDGVLAGKWWGPKGVRPIVCLHGWQDNAGTFDKLIPLLPRDQSFLAIDLPGHGLTSRVPDGMSYHVMDNLYLLNFLCKEYNWDRISLMGHSMGSILSFLYASVFPSKVDLLVQIDALKPQVLNPEMVAEGLQDRVENFMLADQRNQENSEPPSYTMEEMIEKMVSGTFGSVNEETAQFLIKRNIRRSEKYPGKFYFTRDSRLKYQYSPSFNQQVIVAVAKRMDMPHIFFKATKSPFYEHKKYFDEVIDVLRQNKHFEMYNIDSTHHLHLTEPEKVAPIITEFIAKHRSFPAKL